MVWIITKFTRPTKKAPGFDSETLLIDLLIRLGYYKLWKFGRNLSSWFQFMIQTAHWRRYPAYTPDTLRTSCDGYGLFVLLGEIYGLLLWGKGFRFCGVYTTTNPLFFVRYSESGFKALNYPTNETMPEYPTDLITTLFIRTWIPLHSGKIMSFEKRFWRLKVIILQGFGLKYTVISIHYIWSIALRIS
jgi:hypothetical protein